MKLVKEDYGLTQEQLIVIDEIVSFVKNKLNEEATGHDWLHAYRVWKNAIKICKKEKADMFVVQVAALLHDIADWKFNDGDLSKGSEISYNLLKGLNVEDNVISDICHIINNISFKGIHVEKAYLSKEGQIVQDADRLDALGAIGIARTFAYGGYKKREIYNPEIKPVFHETFEQYKNSQGPALNHFYEKLLFLKDLMNTNTAKELAEDRHVFMEKYLERFHEEVE